MRNHSSFSNSGQDVMVHSGCGAQLVSAENTIIPTPVLIPMHLLYRAPVNVTSCEIEEERTVENETHDTRLVFCPQCRTAVGFQFIGAVTDSESARRKTGLYMLDSTKIEWEVQN